MSIRIDIEGTFFSREEAADAIAAVARDIRYGRYSAQARATDNPLVSVTEVDDGDLTPPSSPRSREPGTR